MQVMKGVHMFNLTVRQIKSLQKLKLGREEQMARNIPNTYHDIRFENGCNEQYHDYNIAVIGVMNEITTKEVNGKLMVRAKVLDRVSNRNLNIAWFGMYDIYKTYRYSVGNYFLVYGKLRYDENYHSFQMTNPFLFTTEIESNMRFHPVYSKHK